VNPPRFPASAERLPKKDRGENSFNYQQTAPQRIVDRRTVPGFVSMRGYTLARAAECQTRWT